MTRDDQTIILAKLIDALLRKDTEQDGNWGYPSFHAELTEMALRLLEDPAVQKAVCINPAGFK